MTMMRIEGETLVVRFTTAEKILGLVRDQRIPASAVDAVTTVDDGLAAARGLRAPGLGLPGVRKLGTWRTRRGTSLVSVRRDQPAVRVELSGQAYSTLLIGDDAPERLAAAVGTWSASEVKESEGRPETTPRPLVQEIEVTIPVGDDRLSGTLALPTGGPRVSGVSGRLPAALLVAGSGPVDRDSNARGLRLDITRQLAVALAGAGVASLRYDKRGVGRSEPSHDWREYGVGDRIDEARAAALWLGTRAEVDADRMVVVGHSEGALAAASIGADGPAVAGVVLLSASATPGEELLLWQVRQIAPTLPAPVRFLLRLTRTDLTAKVAKNHARIKGTTTDVARIGGVKTNARWSREFLALDPKPVLSRLTCPVLAVTGAKDLQVDPTDLDVIARLVPGPVETWLAPDVTHILRRQPGVASLRAYRSEAREPLDAGVTRRVVDWVATTLR